MSCNSYEFKLIEHYGDPTLMEEVEVCLKHWLDWAFLKIGAWTEINSESSGIYGGNFYELFPVEDASYQNNQVYRSLRKDWVYESGINYNSPKQNIESAGYNEDYNDVEIILEEGETVNFEEGQIITIVGNELFSGSQTITAITGNNSFTISTDDNFLTQIDTAFLVQNGSELVFEYTEPTGTGYTNLGYVYGTYDPPAPKVYYDGGLLSNLSYKIDYPNGKVILSTGLGANPYPVTAEYAYRNIQTYIASEAPQIFEIEKDSLDPSAIDQSQIPLSGTVVTKDFTMDPSTKIQLPAVIIEAVANRESAGYQLGSRALKSRQDVLLTVVSQNKYECNIISDILANQKHKTIKLYDIDVVNKKGKNPLTHEGYLNTSGLGYSDLANTSSYFWADCWIKDAVVNEVVTKSPSLFMSKVRYQTEVIRG